MPAAPNSSPHDARDAMIPEPRGPTCPDAIVDDHAGNDPDHPTFVMRLCNFATGGAGLLVPSHHIALRDRLLPVIGSCRSCFIDVLGYASRLKCSQNPSGNLALSRARSISVVNYLSTMLSTMELRFRFNVVDGRGDSDSYRDASPDLGFRRAALIRIYCQDTPTDRPPQEVRHGFTTGATDPFDFEDMEGDSLSGRLFQANCMFVSSHDLRSDSIRSSSYRSTGLTAPVRGSPVVLASAKHKSTPVAPTNALVVSFSFSC